MLRIPGCGSGDLTTANLVKYVLIGILLILSIILFGNSRADSGENFRLQLKWVPQAQFMGFYVAEALGYYEKEGLSVDILPGGPGINPSDVVREGRADAVVEWLPTVLAERERGFHMVNFAQILQHSGLLLVCKRDRGVLVPQNLRGKTVSVWYGGNEVPLLRWLESLGIELGDGENRVKVVEQGDVVEDWNSGKVDCVSAMSYNEYWRLISGEVPVSSTTVFNFSDLGYGLLEDGIYVDERRLSDPDFLNRLSRFLRASIRGWEYALSRPTEAVKLLMQAEPGIDEFHQQRMAEEIVRLVDRETFELGLMRIDAYDRTVGLLLAQTPAASFLEGSPERAWTHDLWYELEPDSRSAFSIEVRYRLDQILSANAFYILDLIGTLAFGIAGFARAQERKYDIWGALVLTSLPAVGGGTIRDLLVGGDRHPPFVFTDSNYIYIVLAIVAVGTIYTVMSSKPRSLAESFPRFLLITDTIGLAAFCIIGAKVAIVAELDWFWIPCLAALTCAGGGVLLDIVTGREPRTFRGVMYEEIAILGGLFLFGMLYLANFVEDVQRHIVISIVATFVLVFSVRLMVVKFGWSDLKLHTGASTDADDRA